MREAKERPNLEELINKTGVHKTELESALQQTREYLDSLPEPEKQIEDYNNFSYRNSIEADLQHIGLFEPVTEEEVEKSDPLLRDPHREGFAQLNTTPKKVEQATLEETLSLYQSAFNTLDPHKHTKNEEKPPSLPQLYEHSPESTPNNVIPKIEEQIAQRVHNRDSTLQQRLEERIENHNLLNEALAYVNDATQKVRETTKQGIQTARHNLNDIQDKLSRHLPNKSTLKTITALGAATVATCFALNSCQNPALRTAQTPITNDTTTTATDTTKQSKTSADSTQQAKNLSPQIRQEMEEFRTAKRQYNLAQALNTPFIKDDGIWGASEAFLQKIGYDPSNADIDAIVDKTTQLSKKLANHDRFEQRHPYKEDPRWNDVSIEDNPNIIVQYSNGETKPENVREVIKRATITRMKKRQNQEYKDLRKAAQQAGVPMKRVQKKLNNYQIKSSPIHSQPADTTTSKAKSQPDTTKQQAKTQPDSATTKTQHVTPASTLSQARTYVEQHTADSTGEDITQHIINPMQTYLDTFETENGHSKPYNDVRGMIDTLDSKAFAEQLINYARNTDVRSNDDSTNLANFAEHAQQSRTYQSKADSVLSEIEKDVKAMEQRDAAVQKLLHQGEQIEGLSPVNTRSLPTPDSLPEATTVYDVQVEQDTSHE